MLRSRWALCWAFTSLSQLADGMTYYSCPDVSVCFGIIAQERLGRLVALAYPEGHYKVDPGGFEPPTFSMPLRRAPNCAMGPEFQYSVVSVQLDSDCKLIIMHRPVDLRGFEPLTSSVRLRRAPNCATGPKIRRRTFYLRRRVVSSKL